MIKYKKLSNYETRTNCQTHSTCVITKQIFLHISFIWIRKKRQRRKIWKAILNILGFWKLLWTIVFGIGPENWYGKRGKFAMVSRRPDYYFPQLGAAPGEANGKQRKGKCYKFEFHPKWLNLFWNTQDLDVGNVWATTTFYGDHLMHLHRWVSH